MTYYHIWTTFNKIIISNNVCPQNKLRYLTRWKALKLRQCTFEARLNQWISDEEHYCFLDWTPPRLPLYQFYRPLYQRANILWEHCDSTSQVEWRCVPHVFHLQHPPSDCWPPCSLFSRTPCLGWGVPDVSLLGSFFATKYEQYREEKRMRGGRENNQGLYNSHINKPHC